MEEKGSEIVDMLGVAQHFGICRKTAYTWAKEGRLPFLFQIGRTWLCHRCDLEGFKGKMVQ